MTRGTSQVLSILPKTESKEKKINMKQLWNIACFYRVLSTFLFVRATSTYLSSSMGLVRTDVRENDKFVQLLAAAQPTPIVSNLSTMVSMLPATAAFCSIFLSLASADVAPILHVEVSSVGSNDFRGVVSPSLQWTTEGQVSGTDYEVRPLC